MGLSRLEISHFRNIENALLEPDPGLNVITGQNASGKTSLLEAIFYLSLGRSFRGSGTKHLIQYEQDFFRLLCQVSPQDTNIGIERSLSDLSIRVNHQSVTRISELSTLLPISVIHPDSHQLVTEGPEQRRQFIDWGVFHVEQLFLNAWKNFKKALSQRNAALKQQQSYQLCSLWDKELSDHADTIEQARSAYVVQLCEEATALAARLFPDIQIELSFKRGWPADVDYSDYLKESLQRDRERGFTQSGPHRADLKILVNGKLAESSISRGQQKKLVTLLKLAQLSLFNRTSSQAAILLFDDLPAELDINNQNLILSILAEMNIQLFVTAINAKQIDLQSWSVHKMFHVEHGQVESL